VATWIGPFLLAIFNHKSVH